MEDFRIELTTDGEKLFIVLKNLLSNAFKYTHSGGQVMLNYVEINDTLQISIQDTGKGILEKDLAQIFKPYFQTSNVAAPIEGGTGIGLAICKEYIKQLGGSIQVNSELGKGSIFMIQFPKQLANFPISETTNLSFIQTNQSKTTLSSIVTSPTNAPSILIVEDNLDICQYLQIILQEDYQVTFANNGAEGLAKLEKQTPDLILTDLMMPVMDGFEFMKKVKSQDKWRAIPVIALTARSEMTDKLHALRIGVDDYLVKPFLEDELKCNDKKWVFVYFHEGPWTNYWGADYNIPVNLGGDYYQYDGNIMVRDHLVPLFEQYDVDFVLAGHSHLYERGEKNGVTYVTSGSAGDSDPSANILYANHPELIVNILDNVYARFNVSDDSVYLECINKDNLIVDTYSKSKPYEDYLVIDTTTNTSCYQGS